MTGSTIDDYWAELVTTALLGTDRRDPPEPPPGSLADVVADAARPDPGSRLLAAVAATAAARRAAFVPLPAAPRLHRPPHDPRPLCPPEAAATWFRVVDEWPVLEDEWMLTVVAEGYRLPPDVLVASLVRHHRDSVRFARTMKAGGPTADWVIEHVEGLGGPTGALPAGAVESLPELPLPPELVELVGLDAHTFARRLVPGFGAEIYGPAHRAVLVNLFARCRPEVLFPTAEQLRTVGSGLALALADLAESRGRMLAELERR